MVGKIISSIGIIAYKHLLRPPLFYLTKKDPEIAHENAIKLLSWLSRRKWLRAFLYFVLTEKKEELRQTVCGLVFPSPICLAAGFDKNGVAILALESFGVGAVEIGTVTGVQQPGNERPRIWRYPRQKSLVNCMGFNNVGVDAMVEELKFLRAKHKLKCPLGINFGKSAKTALEAAPGEYAMLIKKLYPYGDYFVINISSPNTEDLRKLQFGEQLTKLLSAVMREVAILKGQYGEKPIFIKLAPDMTNDELDTLLSACDKAGIKGIIIANTTIKRELLGDVTIPNRGGLSGPMLKKQALEMIHYIRSKKPAFTIIGVGEIFTPEDASEMMIAGASLVQVYTGYIYEGPFIFRYLAAGILSLMERDNIPHVQYLHRHGEYNQ